VRTRNAAIVAVLAAAALALLWWQRSRTGGDSPAPPPASSPPAATQPPGSRAQPTPRDRPGPLRANARVELEPAVAGADASAVHGAFAGKVVDWGTGLGVPGAEIVFARDDAGITVETGADGTFRFAPPETGRYRLAVASADGYLPFAPAWNQSPIELVARAGMRVEGIIVYLSPAVDYRGRVVDGDGAPVDGARVTVLGAADGERALLPIDASFTTDAGGEFSFHAPDGAILEARHDCCEPGRAVVDGAVEVSHRLEIVLGKGPPASAREPARPDGAASVRGVVRAGGDPVPAFAVAVLRERGLAEDWVTGGRFFDADGRFEVGGLPEGDYLVRVLAFGFAPSPAVPARASADPREVEVALTGGGTLFGVVVDATTGEPLAHARVSVENSVGSGSSALPMATSIVTDDDGGFELPGLPPGKSSVVVAAFAHHTRIVGGLDVAEGARIGPMTVELNPTADGEKPKLELAGIGAALGAADDGLVVQTVFPGGGADDAGLRPGDVILAVDGARVVDLGFGGTIQRIRGIEGTTVTLEIRSGDEVRRVVATRKKIRT
jgi:hypothetical protein